MYLGYEEVMRRVEEAMRRVEEAIRRISPYLRNPQKTMRKGTIQCTMPYARTVTSKYR